MRHPLLLLALALALAGCGGGEGQGSVTQPPPPTQNPPPGGGGQLREPIVVQVSGGTTADGIDMVVPAPADSPSPNAEVLGVTPVGSGGSAFSTGDVIRRGATMRVILFGANLSRADQVTVSGPNDITIANVRSITANDDTPGISFEATVSGSAALGARTVILRSDKDDVTTFTGGLEVVP